MGDMWQKAKQFIGIEEEREELTEEIKRDTDAGLIKFKSSRKNSNPIREGEYEVVIYEPKVYEDSLSVSSKLREGNPVIINLKHLDAEEGTRLIDFVCGAAYAIDGHMMRIGESIFLFTPTNIVISNIEEKSSLEQELGMAEKESFFRRK